MRGLGAPFGGPGLVDDLPALGAPLMLLESPTEVDFAAGTGTWSWGEAWPTMRGKMLYPLAVRVKQSALAGVAAANVGCTIGSNATLNNIANGGNFATIANINSAVSQGTTKNNFWTVAANPFAFPLPELTGFTPSIFVSSAASAGTTFKGYLQVLGYLTRFLP